MMPVEQQFQLADPPPSRTCHITCSSPRLSSITSDYVMQYLGNQKGYANSTPVPFRHNPHISDLPAP